MSKETKQLFNSELKVINIGVEQFADSMRSQGVKVMQVDWRPPAGGDRELAALLDRLSIMEEIEAANRKAMQILADGQPTWVDVMLAKDFIPAFEPNWILIAGSPIEPADMQTPTRNSVCGAAVHEGLAATVEEAWQKVLNGEIIVKSHLDHNCAGGAGYAVGAHTPLQIVEDRTSGVRAGCAFQEGPSVEALRWGIYTPAIEKRLTWFDDVLFGVMRDMIRASGGINIRNILAQAESMGDENHSRQIASTALLFQQMVPHLMGLDIEESLRREVMDFICSADRFFLHVFIAGAAAMLKAISNIEYCTVVTAFGGNGTDFALKVSALGDRWFAAPCLKTKGMLLNPNWTEADTGCYFGDSCIVECYGFGGASAAAGPSAVRLYGGGNADALRRTADYRKICVGTHDWAPIPQCDFQGPPVGIDIRRVVDTGISPTIHGGIGHKDGGQAGAGAMLVPMECFHDALRAFAEKYGCLE